MNNLIEIKGVTHAYQTPNGPLPVLDDLNLSVPEGEFAAVVGPSGCGKSTLTRLVTGLMKPDQGEVWMGQPSAGPIRVDNDLGTREKSLSNTFEAREAFFLTVKRIIFSSTFSALCS